MAWIQPVRIERDKWDLLRDWVLQSLGFTAAIIFGTWTVLAYNEAKQANLQSVQANSLAFAAFCAQVSPSDTVSVSSGCFLSISADWYLLIKSGIWPVCYGARMAMQGSLSGVAVSLFGTPAPDTAPPPLETVISTSTITITITTTSTYTITFTSKTAGASSTSLPSVQTSSQAPPADTSAPPVPVDSSVPPPPPQTTKVATTSIVTPSSNGQLTTLITTVSGRPITPITTVSGRLTTIITTSTRTLGTVSPSTSPETSLRPGTGLHTPEIIGIVVSISAGVAALLALVIFGVARKKRQTVPETGPAYLGPANPGR